MEKPLPNWVKRERKKRVVAHNILPMPKAVSEEDLDDLFSDYENKQFHIFFKNLRKLLEIDASALSSALGQKKGFIDQFEKSLLFLPEASAKKCVEIFHLNERFAVEFLDKWETYAGKYRQPKVLGPKDRNGPADIPESLPEKTVSVEEILETPLGRLAEQLCIKAGINLGLNYLQRNGSEITISNLGPNVNSCTQLMEVCALAKKLRLGPKDIRDLAILMFYVNRPGKYSLTIKGGGPDFLELIICLAAKQANISTYENEDED